MNRCRAGVLVVLAGMVVVACGAGDERAHFGSRLAAVDAGDADSGPAVTSAAGGSGGNTSGTFGMPIGVSGSFDRGALPGDAAVLDAASDTGAPGDAAPVTDAAPPADAAPGCATRSVWYADDDHDGFGDASRLVVACNEPSSGGWATNAGDCDDGDARVHPGQTTYFGEPYAARNGDDSFDYDCSGGEDVDPSLPLAPADCSVLALGSCGGSGYLPTARAGAGTSPLCGSVQKLTCSVDALVLCAPTKATVKDAFGCR